MAGGVETTQVFHTRGASHQNYNTRHRHKLYRPVLPQQSTTRKLVFTGMKLEAATSARQLGTVSKRVPSRRTNRRTDGRTDGCGTSTSTSIDGRLHTAHCTLHAAHYSVHTARRRRQLQNDGGDDDNNKPTTMTTTTARKQSDDKTKLN